MRFFSGLLILSLLLVACDDSKDEIKQEVASENEVIECTKLDLFSIPVWYSEDNRFQFYSDKGNQYISFNEEEATLYEETLLWIWSDTREGKEESYRYTCNCDKCDFSIGDQTYVLVPTNKEIIKIDKVIYPQNIQLDLQGKYYKKDSYTDEVLNITQSKIIYNLSLTSYIAMDLLEKVSEDEYLVHLSSSLNAQLPFSNEQGDWFSVIKFHLEDHKECPICHTDHAEILTFSLSDYWSLYRTEAKDKRVYSTTDDVYLNNFTDCHIEVIEPDYDLNGIWYSDKGEWSIDFEKGSYTHYDTRKLNYLETLSRSDLEEVYLFTYGAVPAQTVMDPTRYNNLYTHIVKATKDDNCYVLKHSLETEGYFGGYDVTLATTEERICKTEDIISEPITFYSDLLGTVLLGEDNITVKDLEDVTLLKAKVESRNKTDNSTSYFEDLIIKVEEGTEGVYKDCISKYSKIRVFTYPNGIESDPRYYIYLMYPKSSAISCLDSTEEVDAYSPSFTKKKGPYYKEEN
jgi:hypothetical protein